MQETSIKCHKEHKESTKTDWKVGEVAGVLEVIRPLDRDVARARTGLRRTLTIMAAISGSLLALSVVILLVGHRRRAIV